MLSYVSTMARAPQIRHVGFLHDNDKENYQALRHLTKERCRKRLNKKTRGQKEEEKFAMATVVPPPSKRQKRQALERSQIQQDVTAVAQILGSFRARFVDGDGKQLANVIEVSFADASEKNMSQLLNTLLENDKEEAVPYRFKIQVSGSGTVIDHLPTDPSQLPALLEAQGVGSASEVVLDLVAEPQAVFKVNPVSRLSHRIPGHGEAILTAQFSPATSSLLATGSGDTTARIWDADTGTPKFTLKGHTGPVIGVSWSPDGEYLATCSMGKRAPI